MERKENQLHYLLQKQELISSFLLCSIQQFHGSEWSYFDVPSDIIIKVHGARFALHKFPLISRCGRIRRLLSEHNVSDISTLELLNLPGGSDSFELAAKFCYGVNFEITSSNVAQLCCVSEFLEMTEEYENDNLSSRAESYLDNVVCKSLELSVEVLKKCEKLLPLADELKIIGRCVDAIASTACVEQIASSFSRLEYSSSGRLQTNKQAKCGGDWWIEDLSVLCIELYRRVIEAIKCRGVRPESIGASLMNFAENLLMRKPIIWNSTARSRGAIASCPGIREDKIVVETIVDLLPVEKPAVPINFLFGLLRVAVMLDCTMACRLNLERRIGSQLELATLDDLLMLSSENSREPVLEVETAQRILVNFFQKEDSENDMSDGSGHGSDGRRQPSQTALMKVAKLIEGYLAEIASDANLEPEKFMAVAEALPRYARVTDDGLYRAIDNYLKVHTGLTDQERKKLCKLIDFQKLSEEAGSHAAQNERLPLQSIVQALYCEQLRLKNALCFSYPDDDQKYTLQSRRASSGAVSATMSPRDNYASLRRENRELKLELARMRMRLSDLEKGHACIRQDLEKSSSRKFMCSSISSRIGKLKFFSRGSSRGPASPRKNSRGKTEFKIAGRP